MKNYKKNMTENIIGEIKEEFKELTKHIKEGYYDIELSIYSAEEKTDEARMQSLDDMAQGDCTNEENLWYLLGYKQAITDLEFHKKRMDTNIKIETKHNA